MSEAYERVKGGRLTFKGGTLATTSKAIDKNKKKKTKKDKIGGADGEKQLSSGGATVAEVDVTESGGGDSEIYTIDAAKRKKYEQLFPVEAKKFGYEDKSKFKSVEDALDDRVKKKADRYCK